MSVQEKGKKVNLWLLLSIAIIGSSGCIMSPRSAVFGQTALSGLGKGGAEAGISAGVSFRQVTGPKEDDGTRSIGESFILGSAEANAIIGFSDRIGLNIHISQAGIQPGLKIMIFEKWVSMAIIPEVAFGYWSYNENTEKTSGGSTSSEEKYDYSTFGLMAGLKFLISTKIGLYGGFGYDFQYEIPSAATGVDYSNVSHILALAIGYDMEVGPINLRPELSFCITPSITQSGTKSGTTITSSGGSSFMFFPNLTFAIAVNK